MSGIVQTPLRQFPVAAAMAAYLRVKTPTGLVLAGATDIELGTLETATQANEFGDAYWPPNVGVRLRTAQGTVKMVAAGAIAAGALCYAAAGGKIASSGTIVVGTAIDAATANNDVIEVERLAVGAFSVATGLGSATVAAAGSTDADAAALTDLAINRVTAADATKGVILPVPTGPGDLVLVFNSNTGSHALPVYPDSGNTINGGVASSGSVSVSALKLAYFVADDAGAWTAIYS